MGESLEAEVGGVFLVSMGKTASQRHLSENEEKDDHDALVLTNN